MLTLHLRFPIMLHSRRPQYYCLPSFCSYPINWNCKRRQPVGRNASYHFFWKGSFNYPSLCSKLPPANLLPSGRHKTFLLLFHNTSNQTITMILQKSKQTNKQNMSQSIYNSKVFGPRLRRNNGPASATSVNDWGRRQWEWLTELHSDSLPLEQGGPSVHRGALQNHIWNLVGEFSVGAVSGCWGNPFWINGS